MTGAVAQEKVRARRSIERILRSEDTPFGEIRAGQCFRRHLVQLLKSAPDLKYIGISAHGTSDGKSLVGDDGKVLIGQADHELFSGCLVHALSCHAAADLGLRLSEAGATFIGYSDAVEARPELIPLLAKLDTAVAKAFLADGKTAGEASGLRRAVLKDTPMSGEHSWRVLNNYFMQMRGPDLDSERYGDPNLRFNH